MDDPLLLISSIPTENRAVLLDVQASWTQNPGRVRPHFCENSMWHMLCAIFMLLCTQVCIPLPHLFTSRSSIGKQECHLSLEVGTVIRPIIPLPEV